MPLLTPAPESAAQLRGRARALARFPRTLAQLAGRGTPLAPGVGEGTEAFEARLETAVMALFRETGEAADFEALYALGAPGLLEWIAGFARSRGSSADPHDLLQDAFVNVYRYARGFRDEHGQSFRVWARTIAANVVRRRLMGLGRASLQALPEGLQEPADCSADPATAVERDEQGARMGRAWTLVLLAYADAVAQLGERDRLALHLVEVEGLSYAAAGARLGVRLSNMKMIVFRARKRVRDRIRLALGDARPVESAADLRRTG